MLAANWFRYEDMLMLLIDFSMTIIYTFATVVNNSSRLLKCIASES